jgi:hypothetical protein
MVLFGFLLDPVFSPVMVIDNILPQSLLAKTTPDEIQFISKGLRGIIKTNWFTISLLIAVIIGNSAALFIANRKITKYNPNQPVDPTGEAPVVHR